MPTPARELAAPWAVCTMALSVAAMLLPSSTTALPRLPYSCAATPVSLANCPRAIAPVSPVRSVAACSLANIIANSRTPLAATPPACMALASIWASAS